MFEIESPYLINYDINDGFNIRLMSDFEKSLLVKSFCPSIFSSEFYVQAWNSTKSKQTLLAKKIGTYLFQNVFFFIVVAAWFSFDV